MSRIYAGSLKGHFLVAMPGLADPNFSQTVTCICEHNEQGAMGIVINRVHDGLCAKNLWITGVLGFVLQKAPFDSICQACVVTVARL